MTLLLSPPLQTQAPHNLVPRSISERKNGETKNNPQRKEKDLPEKGIK